MTHNIRRRHQRHQKHLEKEYQLNAPVMFHLKYPEVMMSVREISTKEGSGTGFIFKYKNKNFLITAKHVAINKKRVDKRKIGISQHDGEPYAYEANLYFHQNKNSDTCVIELPVGYKVQDALEYHDEPVIVGEEHLFCGYPGSIDRTFAFTGNANFSGTPIGVIRKGIVSSFNKINDIYNLYVDAHAGPGFSGSPLVGINEEGNPYVIGVISGGNIMPERIVDETGKEIDQFSITHTGLSVADHIIFAIDIIEENNLV